MKKQLLVLSALILFLNYGCGDINHYPTFTADCKEFQVETYSQPIVSDSQIVVFQCPTSSYNAFMKGCGSFPSNLKIEGLDIEPTIDNRVNFSLVGKTPLTGAIDSLKNNYKYK